ncbi:cAMP-regulated phosphoprotein/endosulfine conserved region, partial [Musa troglodytarum]
MTDNQNCGQCGKKCWFGQACCGGSCVNVMYDRKNCGGCNKRCKKGCVYQFGILKVFSLDSSSHLATTCIFFQDFIALLSIQREKEGIWQAVMRGMLLPKVKRTMKEPTLILLTGSLAWSKFKGKTATESLKPKLK